MKPMIKALSVILCALCLLVVTPLYAQESDQQADFERRLELAEQLQEFRPAREQVDNAIDQYVSRISPQRRETYRAALKNILNYKALERISIDAYADVFTAEELTAMVEYYSKPEARSAADKFDEYGAQVYPEIVRMLDQAMIRAKTGGAP